MCLSVTENAYCRLTYCDLNTHTTVCRLTCVWDECLQVGAGSLVLQQLLWWHVCEEDLQDDLSVLAVFGVGVPHDTVPQESL